MMERLGLLVIVLPELQGLRGVPQAKARHGDALDHSLRTADALPAGDPYLRLFGLLHDVGKASTLGDGHFIGHEVVGTEMVEAVLRRLHVPRVEVARGRLLVRHHMFAYGGRIYFDGYGTHGQGHANYPDLWVTDGTQGGTIDIGTTVVGANTGGEW